MGTSDIRDYIIGLCIFTLVIVGGVAMLGSLSGDRPELYSGADGTRYEAFNKTFNKQNALTGQVDKLEADITDADTDWGIFGVLNALINTAWNSLSLILSSFSFMDGAINGLTTFFGVPAWIPLIILAIITIIIIFAILEAIFQR